MALVKGTNSYVNVAEADAYFVDRVHNEDWDGIGVNIQEEALVTATGLLDLLTWQGVSASETQSLAFPRAGYYYSKSRNRNIEFDSDATEVPLLVKTATYELALHLIQNATVLESRAEVEDLSIGTIKLEDIRPVAIIPNRILRYISDFLVNSGSNAWFRSN